jgi:hypothetical protein
LTDGITRILAADADDNLHPDPRAMAGICAADPFSLCEYVRGATEALGFAWNNYAIHR